MKLSNLASPSTTKHQLTHPMMGKIDVFIEGYTPDSEQWRNYDKQLSDPNKKTSMYIEKGGKNSIELDNDGIEKRRKLLGMVVTNITGLEGWTFSPENVQQMFKDPQYSWIVDDWGDHLDDRKNYMGKSVAPATTGSEASGGSTQEKIE